MAADDSRLTPEALAAIEGAGKPPVPVPQNDKTTPKQQYEARKAERGKLKDMDYQLKQRTETDMTLDLLDRFVTAVERIADALERTNR